MFVVVVFSFIVCVWLYIYIHVQKGSKMFTDIILLQENDSKRARALKKAAEEREMRRAKDREIARYWTGNNMFQETTEIILSVNINWYAVDISTYRYGLPKQ